MSFAISTEFDRATNWNKRLALELPFIRAWLRSWNARKVTDLACGSGRHLAALADDGMELTGVDCSRDLLDLARDAAPAGCTFLEGNMVETAGPAEQEAMLCLGNSISLLKDRAEVRQSLEAMHDALVYRGGLMIHLLNYDRFRNPDNCFFPLKTDLDADGRPSRHFLKSVMVCGDKARVHIASMAPDEAGIWRRESRWDDLLALSACELNHMLADCGFAERQIFGGFNGDHYTAATSHDLVICARRA